MAAQPRRPIGPRDDLRRWLDDWRVRGEALDRERLNRLRALNETGAARIACDLLWPMAEPGAGDSGEGLLRIKQALRRLSSNR